MNTCDIIDAHIHPALDADSDTRWFGSSGDFETQVETLRRAGITRACGTPIRRLDAPESFAPMRELNDGALHLRDRFPGFYEPAIHVHPRFPDESCREIERCCGREGVRWIGELVGYHMGFGDEYATDDALHIFRVAMEHGAIVNIHCADLDVVDRLCRALSELTVVLAHPGAARDMILERLALVGRHPRLYLDLSGSGIDRFGVVRRAIDVVGVEKLIFGTDYPINNPAVYVQGVLFEPLTEAERQAVFNGNFLRLTQR